MVFFEVHHDYVDIVRVLSGYRDVTEDTLS